MNINLAEVGRSCVHVDHRNGTVIALLWRGLADYMRRHGFEYMNAAYARRLMGA